MELRRWLIIDPSGRDTSDQVRVVQREPTLARGQAAFPLMVRIPESPRRVFTDRPITVTMPGWTPPEVDVGPAEFVEETTIETGT